MRLVDANVIIRYLIDEDTDNGKRSLALLLRVSTGDEQVTICEGALAEIVHVLSSVKLYARSRQEIALRLGAVIELRGLVVQHKDVYLASLERYAASSIDFVDCLNIAFMQKLSIVEIMSFDHDFDRIEGITRVEP